MWSEIRNLYDQSGQSEQCDQTTDRNNLVSVNNMLNEALTKKTFMISLVNLSSETRKLKEIIVNSTLWATWSVWLIRWKRQCKRRGNQTKFLYSLIEIRSGSERIYSDGQAKCPFQFTAYRSLIAYNFGIIFSWNIAQRIFGP